VLGYECWHEEQTRSAVSFASMVFRDRSQRGARGDLEASQ
jgi:hypothetical protein